MADKATEDIMAAIHKLVADGILSSLEESPTNADLRTAIDFLHKNGIVADLGDTNSDYVTELSDKVITLTEDDIAKSRDPDIIDDPEVLRERFRNA